MKIIHLTANEGTRFIYVGDFGDKKVFYPDYKRQDKVYKDLPIVGIWKIKPKNK